MSEEGSSTNLGFLGAIGSGMFTGESTGFAIGSGMFTGESTGPS